MDLPWVRLIVRRDEKGLSTAVIRGLQEAGGGIGLMGERVHKQRVSFALSWTQMDPTQQLRSQK